ncbi:MAG: LapA family protein [Candidatus Aminicenantes bacterium]|nr:LapA family protein [Candidatus Aminicenantes bacterium]MDH5383802.1 LapA family protein [Candidatus Aminicenantes bacterium]MDH5744226.1 LapA family protein [Candidatus Aminicenantes bacterium]
MKPKYIIIIILAVLALILALQNTEVMTFQLFFWTISMSRILMMVGFLIIGFLVGLLVGRL